jgi:protein-tyrosine-phosphatase/predicted ATP-grasp superfamily ATP-dependent carboligase
MTTLAGRKVLVLDADMVPALTITRSLAAQSCVVDVASHVAAPIAGRSRRAARKFRYPSPLASPAKFVDWLCHHLAAEHYDLVIPVTERTLVPLSNARQRLSAAKVAMPGEHSLTLVLDKAQTLTLAQELGVAIPRSVTVASLEELNDIQETLHYPVVVKPARSIGSKDGGASHLQVSYAFDAVGLVARCKHALRYGAVVLQEYFGGDGVGVELIADQGAIHYAFQHRRLHEVPLTGGGSSLRVSEPLNPRLLEASAALIGALQWHGVAMVEFKLDPQTGAFCLMEINGRFWGSLPLANAAGADFPAMLAQLELNGRIGNFPDYRPGVYCRLLARDLWWYESVLRGEGDPRLVKIPSTGEVIKELRLFLSPRHYFDVQNFSDPLPGLFDLIGILDSYAARLKSLANDWLFRRQQKRAWRNNVVMREVERAQSILFLCYGNINRSALADAMIRAYAEDSGVAIYSAGFHEESARPADPMMVEIAAHNGVDMTWLRSTTVTDEMLRKSDVIFVMEKAHYDRLLAMRPDVEGRVFLLGAYPSRAPRHAEIGDPYGQSRQAYAQCYARIAESADHIKAMLAMRVEG